jgi:hypothetical protein
MRAESAEIDEVIQHSVNDSVTAAIGEAWDCERSRETSGGLLKHIDNPRLLRNVAEMLRVVRLGIESSGFCKDPWILRKIYGLDHDGSAPFGTPFQVYLRMADEAAEHAKGIPRSESLEDLKNKMFKILDSEIKRVEGLAEDALRSKIVKTEYMKVAALIPPLPVSERFLRYETHLSREFDRTLAQLERLQRMRLGQPVLPPISVRLSR